MNAVSIIIAILLAAAVFFAVRSIIKNRGRCSFCNGSCPGCKACRNKKG